MSLTNIFNSISSIKLCIVLVLLGANLTQAQIKITYPVERAIYQRDNSNRATLHIGGNFSQPIDKVEARLVPVIAGQGVPKDWTTIQTNPTNGTFFGKIVSDGGWYTLEVRGLLAGNVIGRDGLSRIGVGEVFIIAGDSNAEGIPNSGATDSKDERVNTIIYDNRTANSLNDPATMSFGRITAEGTIGPRGRSAWFWGELGDRLANKLNVPILLMNVAMDGTSVLNWANTALNPNTVSTNYINKQNYALGMPYGNLKMAVRYFANNLGLRAVLWQAHEGDVQLNTTAKEYQDKLQLLINFTRGEIFGPGGANDYTYVPWVIARTSRMQQWYNTSQFTSSQLIQAQDAIISTVFNKIYPGPTLDDIQTQRPNGVNFQGTTALSQAAQAWDNSMLPQFFASTVPLLPKPPTTFSLKCDPNNTQLQLQAPAGYAGYKWQDGNTNQNYTVSALGTYSVQLKDPLGGTVQTVPLVVSEAVLPPLPVISPKGEQLVCKDSSLTLTVDVSASNTVTWSDGQVGRVIKAKKAGNYTAKLSNMFGCSSAASAPMTVTVLDMKTPTIAVSGPYSINSKIDPVIYNYKDVVVKNIVWDWRLAGKDLPSKDLPSKDEFLKITQTGAYTVRQRVTLDAIGGGNVRVCPTLFSNVFNFTAPTTDDGVILYPNPNYNGWVGMESFKDMTNVQVTVFNLTGQLIHEQKIPVLDNHKELNLSALNEGIYLIKITAGGFSQTKKLIIDK